MKAKQTLGRALAGIRDDITGPSLFNYQVYLFFLPVFWVTSLLSNLRPFTIWGVLAWTIANFAAIGLCLLLVLVADRTWFKNRKTRSTKIAYVLGFGFSIGAIKGALTTMVAWALLVEPNLDFVAPRALQAALLGLVTLPALAVLSATQMRFQSERDSLVAERVKLAASELEMQGSAKVDYSKLLAAIEELQQLASAGSRSQIPPLLHEVVREHLRPLTHRLWEEESSKQKDFSFKSMSRVAILSSPFARLPVALIIGFGSLIPYVVQASLPQGILRALLTACTIWVGFSMARLFKPRSLAMAVAYFLSVHLAVSAGVVSFSNLAFGPLPALPTATAVVVLFIWLTQTAFMCSYISGAVETRSEIRSQIESLAKQLGLNDEVVQASSRFASRGLANHLHSNVQNKLLLLALKADTADRETTLAELQEIRGLLSQANAPSIKASTTVRLKSLSASWQGFAHITLQLDELCSSCENKPQLAEVVSEAINNSVRHGLAANIEVVIVCDEIATKVVVTDDGVGPRGGSKGLGSNYFESSTNGNWALENREIGGAELQLRVQH